jgi:hypothetical protein
MGIRVKFKPTLEQVESAMHGTGETGFCIACGAATDDAEPDARGYPCDDCGSPSSVYGIEELVLHGLVSTVTEESV